MNKKERDALLAEFEEHSLTELGMKIVALVQITDKTPNQTTEHGILYKYVSDIRGHVEDLKRKDNPTPEEIQSFFSESKDLSTKLIKELKEDRTWPTIIFDFMKDVANFCIKWLSKLMVIAKISDKETPQFFNTTTKPINTAQRGIDAIEKSMKEFKEALPDDVELHSGVAPGGV